MACLRCGKFSHLASKCPIYTEFCDTNCRRCNLLHRTSEGKQEETRVHTGEVLLERVDEPEILEGEQDGDVDFAPEAVVEQQQEMFQKAEYYGEQWGDVPEADWEVGEGDFYEEENLSPFLLF